MAEQVSAGEVLDSVALTGRLTAALREVESARADRLIDDPFAGRLAGAIGRQLREAFGENPIIAIRTRFFDDALSEIIGEGEISQFVILAAGMDTRALRLEVLRDVPLYELDRPEVLSLKDRLLPSITREGRHPVGVDLAGDWAPALTAAGFSADKPACWLVEGLNQYLGESCVSALFDTITGLSASGSVVLTDFVGRTMLDMPALRPMLDQFAELGAPWIFGTDHPERIFEPRGWRAEITSCATVGKQFGRWSFPELSPEIPAAGLGSFVRARR